MSSRSGGVNRALSAGTPCVCRYLRFLMLSGTFIQDVPFLAVRLWTAASLTGGDSSGPGFSLLYALLLHVADTTRDSASSAT